MAYNPIENYGVIGDMNTVALVGLDGSIDFFCFPDFDSPSVFAALLDDKKGGRFSLAPDFRDSHQAQLYVPDTNVLITRFMSDQGILEVTDFMPVHTPEAPSRIVRLVRAVRGDVSVVMTCAPSFDYGRQEAAVAIDADKRRAVLSGGSQAVTLRTTFDMQETEKAATARFTLKEGNSAHVVLSCDGKDGAEMTTEQVEALHLETIAYWRDWVRKITYKGRWRGIMYRSALVLKLLTSRRHGAIIAAPTFGLPEATGGERNWDYRYCWIRDSAFTVYALIRLGLREEAIAFMHWVEKLYKTSGEADGRLQVMYKIDGTGDIDEKFLDHFEGYRKSKPVRIGNEASVQFQLDIYGELLDAIELANTHISKISYDAWQDVTRTAEYVCKNWKNPDAGIWEFRGEKREFLHSRLMCWVALDRALKLARRESLPADLRGWHAVRAEIYNDIFTNFWDEKSQCFVQHKGTRAIDASVLLMPLVDFIGPHDPRWLSTLKAVGERLASDALVDRYRDDEMDLKPVDTRREGSFNACSFWYIACLARSGKLDEAWLLFHKMISYGNRLGLYAEETGQNGQMLGNFPQAFTHLALINAIFALEEGAEAERATRD